MFLNQLQFVRIHFNYLLRIRSIVVREMPKVLNVRYWGNTGFHATKLFRNLNKSRTQIPNSIVFLALDKVGKEFGIILFPRNKIPNFL